MRPGAEFFRARQAPNPERRNPLIVLTKMNHEKFLVNHLQTECIELIPETKIVMMNRSYYLVRETAEEIVQKIAEYNAKVQDIARAVKVIGQR